MIARVIKGLAVRAAIAAATMVVNAQKPATSCESIASLKLTNATINAGETVAAGAFTPPGEAANAPSLAKYRKLPAFCRVTATLTPSTDSEIKVEVWLPLSAWNGKFQAVGNGGWAGKINYSGLADAIIGGYAATNTDTGHTGSGAEFALGHPETLIDNAYRAVHEMTVQAKAIVTAYYGSEPQLSFWNSCSTGGQQGITEAAKYPSDFDAIVAGAPALNHMRLHIARLAINVFVNRTEDSYIPPAKYALVHDAVLSMCDELDGVKDGVIEDPRECHFDPKVLECKDADGPNCLTPAQVETAQALYSQIKNPKTGAQIMPALLMPGSELG